MYNSIRVHLKERPLRPWLAINLNYEFVGELQGQNNLKIPFITGFSTQPASFWHPQLQQYQVSVLKDTKEFMVVLDNKYIFILRRITSYARER